MKIHAIQTVASLRGGGEGVGHGRRRLVNTLFDREWTEPLPIYAFAIEHPASHERIRAFAADTPTVYLPTHDPETAARLAERRPIGAAQQETIA